MYHKFFVIFTALIGLWLFSAVHIVQADDYKEAKRLLDAGEILPLEQILGYARQTYPGRILEAELENEHGRVVYELEILGDDSIVREIYIDAKSGELLSVEEDD